MLFSLCYACSMTPLMKLCLISFPLLTSCAHRDLPASDHYDGHRFYNEDRSAGIGKGFSAFLGWQFNRERKEWPDFVNDNEKPVFNRDLKRGQVAVTSINHATYVLQFRDLSILTDPVFSERTSPMSWIGPKRHRKVGATIEQLPKVDVVVISHNHYDHLDLNSLVALDQRDRPKFFVALGNRALLADAGIADVVELDWWQKFELPNGSVVTLTPSQHWSARGVFDRSENLWGSYVIEASDLRVYFAGDTGYGRHFAEVNQKFGAMDVSLLPIGAYEPRWFMKDHHMNPDDAVLAHLDLKSRASVGIHFGTFQLTDEGIDEPLIDLVKALEKSKLDPATFVAPKNGQTLVFERLKR